MNPAPPVISTVPRGLFIRSPLCLQISAGYALAAALPNSAHRLRMQRRARSVRRASAMQDADGIAAASRDSWCQHRRSAAHAMSTCRYCIRRPGRVRASAMRSRSCGRPHRNGVGLPHLLAIRQNSRQLNALNAGAARRGTSPPRLAAGLRSSSSRCNCTMRDRRQDIRQLVVVTELIEDRHRQRGGVLPGVTRSPSRNTTACAPAPPNRRRQW